jgi:hypothetical protein
VTGAGRRGPDAWRFAATVALAWAAGGAVASAAPASYRTGPPPGHTGGFGEPTCVECHFGAPLNEPPGALEIRAPERYEPGADYTVRIVLRHPAMAAAGFQLTARYADGGGIGVGSEGSTGGAHPGADAGRLESLDTRTRIHEADDVRYAVQTEEGAALVGRDSVRWTLRWRAPESPAAVVFHVAANVANDDASEFGDRIYTGSATARPAPVHGHTARSDTDGIRPGLRPGSAAPTFSYSPIQWRHP